MGHAAEDGADGRTQTIQAAGGHDEVFVADPRTRKILGLADPLPDPLVTSMDPAPDPSIIKQK